MKIQDWVKYANDWFKNHVLCDGEDIGWRIQGGAYVPYIKNKSLFAQDADYSYTGPFAVVKASSTTVNVYGYNSDAGRLYTAYVIVGLYRVAFADTAGAETPVSVSAAGWIYLEVSPRYAYTEVSLSVSAKFAASLPAQSDAKIYIPLAYVHYADSAIVSIHQVQYGIVHLPTITPPVSDSTQYGLTMTDAAPEWVEVVDFECPS